MYENAGSIYYRDSQISSIRFGSEHTLMTGSLNDPTSTKMNWTDQVVVLAYGSGVLFRRPGVGSTTTTSAPATTSTTRTTSTTTTTRPSTTTTLPPGAVVLDVRVAASSDDAEEASSGSVNLTSGDLELVNDGSLQTVGIRFPGVMIPHGATILTAWVQLEVDETSGEATSLRIEGQAADDAGPFTSSSRNVSTRPRTTAFASWSPPGWPSVGIQGSDQRTPELAALVQQIVDRPGWSSGRAVGLIVTGTGHRVARAYDGMPAGAPVLHVAYRLTGGTSTTTTASTSTSTTTLPGGSGSVTFERRVAASQDDAEEQASGTVDLTSSDLELVEESTTQTVGMRFGSVTIPRGATILAAWLQLQVDEATSPVTTLRIEGEASDDALPFTTASHNVSARPRTAAFSTWAPPAWPQVGATQQSADVAGVIREIVARPGWASGRALTVIVTGTGKRVAESWDGLPVAAPLLHVEYAGP